MNFLFAIFGCVLLAGCNFDINRGGNPFAPMEVKSNPMVPAHATDSELQGSSSKLQEIMPPVPGVSSLMKSSALVASVVKISRPLWVTNNVTLAWRQSLSDGVVGYRLYDGLVSGQYTNIVAVGPFTNVVFTYTYARTNVPRHYFAVTAYDADGVESPKSNEAHYPAYPPVLTGFTLAGHSLIQQSTDLVNWSMPIMLDGSMTLSLMPGNLFFRGTNLTLTPNYQLDTP